MTKAALLATVIALVGLQTAPNELRELTREPATLVIKNVTLVDSRTGANKPGVTIVVAGNRIISIGAHPDSLPSDARVLDGTGKWVIPGFVDAHVHDASEGYLRDMLAWGVTAIHLMPNVPPDKPIEIELKSEMAQTSSPRIQLTEMFAGEFPDNLFPGVYQFIKPKTVDAAAQSVRESNAKGYRQIKIIRDDSFQWSGEAYRVPMISQPVYEAMVTQAHEIGMRVYVHATQRDVLRAAFDTGVDVFMHGVMDMEMDADDWQKMAAAKTVWTATINALHCFGDQRSYARRVLSDERFVALLEESERASWTGMVESEGPIIPPPTVFLVENSEMYVATLDKNTRHALDAGIPIAVGTDGGPAGVSTHLEMEFLQAGGLSPSEVLTAATHGGAVALGREADMGSVEVGKLADMVVLNADPTVDVRNCREIEWVIKGGADYRPRQLALGH